MLTAECLRGRTALDEYLDSRPADAGGRATKEKVQRFMLNVVIGLDGQQLEDGLLGSTPMNGKRGRSTSTGDPRAWAVQ